MNGKVNRTMYITQFNTHIHQSGLGKSEQATDSEAWVSSQHFPEDGQLEVDEIRIMCVVKCKGVGCYMSRI